MGTMDAVARRRTVRLVAAAGAVLVVLALLAIVARRDPPPPPAARPAPTPVPSWVPFAFEPPAALRSFAQLLDPAPRRIPVAQDGLPLRVDALSSTGLLIGGAGFAVDPYRAADRIGVVEPGATGVRWLTDGSDHTIYGRAAGDGVAAWAGSGLNDYQVMCARADAGWRPGRISATGLSPTAQPIRADGRTVAWTDAAGTAWASDDCGRPRPIGRGEVVALALPVAFLRHADDRVEIVPVVGSAPITRLPVGAEQGIRFAVSRDSVVWLANGGLVHYDRGTRRVRLLDAALPTAASSPSGATEDVTVGNRLVAYTLRPTDGGPSSTRAVLYDLITGAWLLFDAEVFVAGDMIVWREAGHYAVTTTS
jgi:hypothetical protein